MKFELILIFLLSIGLLALCTIQYYEIAELEESFIATRDSLSLAQSEMEMLTKERDRYYDLMVLHRANVRIMKPELLYYEELFSKTNLDNTWLNIKGMITNEGFALLCGRLDKLYLINEEEK